MGWTMRRYAKLFERAKGIKLDIGCGLHKQEGCLGMDIVPHPCVDIVHDIQRFPWPVPSNICSFILLSHVWEHIEPKYRFRLMDELWRICRHDGQLWIACPYAGSYLEAAHPAHYMCPNEATFTFFDPEHPLWWCCSYKRPKAWKIIRNIATIGGCIELIMVPRKLPNGKEDKLPQAPTKYDYVKLMEQERKDQVRWPGRKEKPHALRRTSKGQ